MKCVKCGKETADGAYCSICGWKQSKRPEKKTKRGNGTGRVYKRGNTWYAQITVSCEPYTTPDGKPAIRQKRKTKGGFRTKKEALEYLPTLRAEPSHTCPTLNELFQRFEENDLGKLSHNKQLAYHKARDRLSTIMDRPIDQLTTAELQSAVNASAETYYPAKAMKNLISKLYNLAMADQYVPTNLATFISLPELMEEETEAFTADEIEKIWECYDNGNQIAGYALLMIYSGMMPGELLSCKRSMIRYDVCEIWGCGKKTKTRKETPIIFPDFLAPLLKDLESFADINATTDRQGMLLPFNEYRFRREYNAMLESAGVRQLSPYSCRHTTGTAAAKLNLAAPIIQKIMRHSRITTSQRYIHLGSEEAHAGLNQLSPKAQTPNLPEIP